MFTKKTINIIGKKFGKLTVFSFSGRDTHGQLLWNCKCECGNFCIKVGNKLRIGKTKSCGCRRAINLTGKRIGYWLILKEIKNKKAKKWIARCVCGKEKDVFANSINCGKSSSCGCMNIELSLNRGNVGCFSGSHHLCRHPLYKIWAAMKKRCYNKNTKSFRFYGKRGIKIFQDWIDFFENFYEWAINNGYQPGLSIERKDPKKGYYPENCEWITLSENCSRAHRHKNDGKISNNWICIKKIPYSTHSLFECLTCGMHKQVTSWYGTSGKMKKCKCSSHRLVR